MKKIIFVFSVFFFLLAICFCQPASAGILDPGVSKDVKWNVDNFQGAIFGGTPQVNSISQNASLIITAFLGLLAIIFIILIILAGYNWMTANGDDSKVTKVKDTIQKAVIGILIIGLAYGITQFVFTAVPMGGSSAVGHGG
jgi:preprotein translocase subunit SecG